MVHRLTVLLALALVVPPNLACAQSSLPAGFPIEFGELLPVGADIDNGMLSDASVGQSGRVCQADYSNQRISCFSPDGDLLWSTGKQGEGPGEFRGLYRLVVTPADTVLAYDLVGSIIHIIGPDGHFVRRSPLPIRFRQVDDLNYSDRGFVIISGVAPNAGLASDSAVHVFELRDSLKYVRSFGPLPPSKSKEILAYWGAGNTRTTGNGDLIYARRFPYELHIYSPSGVRERMVIGPEKLKFGPDDAIKIENTATSSSVEDDTTRNIVIPLTPIPITNEWILIGRRARKTRMVWLDAIPLTDQRRPVSFEVPRESPLRALIGVDVSRGYLWAIGYSDDAPSLYRIAYHARRAAAR
jgi:hypothetical protein